MGAQRQPRLAARRFDRRCVECAAGAATRFCVRLTGGLAARVRALHRFVALRRGGAVGVELAHGHRPHQRQFVGAVCHARTVGCCGFTGLHPTGFGGHGDGGRDAAPGRCFASGFGGQFHFAVGAARLHDRRRGFDCTAFAHRFFRLGVADPARHGGGVGAPRRQPEPQCSGGVDRGRSDVGLGGGSEAPAAALAVHVDGIGRGQCPGLCDATQRDGGFDRWSRQSGRLHPRHLARVSLARHPV